MRLSSSTSDPYAGTYECPEAAAFGTAEANVGYLLRVEAALSLSAARAGLVEQRDAEAVVALCGAGVVTVHDVRDGLVRDATPVIAVVERLRASLPEAAQSALHPRATSQDVVDTAGMLYARDVIAVATDDAVAIAQRLRALAIEFRSTPMAGRTLGQQAVPTTVGAWAALRLRAIGDAVAHVLEEFQACGCVQLGGPVGTDDVLAEHLAAELGLRRPVTSWHTSRSMTLRIAAAVAALAGELGALANDVVLLSSSEIGELVIDAPGGSSSMPHKRNPSGAINALACAYRIPGALSTLAALMPQGLQRDPGRWQAEWGAWSDVLQWTAGAARHLRITMDGISVDDKAVGAHAAGLLEGEPDGGASRIRAAEVVVDRLVGGR